VFDRGDLRVELYAPRGVDEQRPHERDELYIVVAGRGRFRCAGAEVAFAPGDLLFVPAGMEHRFEAFGDDLVVWVVFFGPHGGYGVG
jgi:mannose-6-phosphate isomerase-like protein (cupin superfamily)